MSTAVSFPVNVDVAALPALQSSNDLKKGRSTPASDEGSDDGRPAVVDIEQSKRSSPKEIVRYFDLAWFAVSMSWGGAGLSLANFQGVSGTFQDILQWVGVVVWIWNCIYWIVFQGLFLARAIMYPRETYKMMVSPRFNFIGCWSMGFGVCAMGFSDLGHLIMPADVAYEIAYWMYNINLVFSVLCALVPVLYISVRSDTTFDNMPSIYLLPVVANVVNAALGGMVGAQTDDEGRGMWILFSSLVELGCGLFSAACMIAVYLCRLMFFGMPPAMANNSIWVILGPIGQGANAILRLGRNAQRMGAMGYFCAGSAACATATPMSSFADSFPGVSLLIGIFMWGFGTFWVATAATGSLYHTRKLKLFKDKVLHMDNVADRRAPYNITWWGCIFPFVTQLSSTYQLYIDTQFGFFLWVGRIWCICICIMAVYVHVKTWRRVISGTIWEQFKPKTG